MQQAIIRPRWNHNNVKAAAALEYVDEVKDWAVLYGAVPDNVDNREFLAAFTLGIQESADSYQAGRYFDDFYEWPVSGTLISILDRCYARMPFIVKRFVAEWVVATGTRFPAKKGDHVDCRIGEVELTGLVVEVFQSEAKAVIELKGNGKLLDVNSEEILKIVSTPDKRKVPSNRKGKT